MTKQKADPRITKRRVTMTNFVVVGVNAKGDPVIDKHVATTYVRPDFLAAFEAKARETWMLVETSDEPDAGPDGYHGATHVPANLDHPLAGQTFPATTED